MNLVITMEVYLSTLVADAAECGYDIEVRFAFCSYSKESYIWKVRVNRVGNKYKMKLRRVARSFMHMAQLKRAMDDIAGGFSSEVYGRILPEVMRSYNTVYGRAERHIGNWEEGTFTISCT